MLNCLIQFVMIKARGTRGDESLKFALNYDLGGHEMASEHDERFAWWPINFFLFTKETF